MEDQQENQDNTFQDLRLSLRPRYLNEFIGQDSIKSNLSVFIKSAKIRSESLDHVLISGPPGLGKTTISQIIANELMIDITATSGPLIEKQGDLAAVLTKLQPNQVLFIDEIHRMNRQIEEVLYSAMEDFKLDILIGQGPYAKTVKIDLSPFTLIGATTRLGMLSAPLRDRFGISFRLEYYSNEQIKRVIKRSSKFMNIKIVESAIEEIASRSRGTPRIANRYLKRCYDYSVVARNDIINYEDVKKALKELNIDSIGLDLLDHKYLDYLHRIYDNQPAGLTTISVALSEDKDTIELVCEPYLIRLGFIKKTTKGRMLTDKGKMYIKKMNFN